MRNSATIIIFHRFSTIENTGRIQVMEHDEIIESGHRQQLMQFNSSGAKRYQQQFH
jgi:ABC-type multidrug transport system fused ATPase/permease subunit